MLKSAERGGEELSSWLNSALRWADCEAHLRLILSRTSKKGCGNKAVQTTRAKRSSAVTELSSRPKATAKSMVPVQGRAQQEGGGEG